MPPKIHVHENSEAPCKVVANEIAELIQRRGAHGKTAVLGLATGGTPMPFIWIARRHAVFANIS